MEYVSFTCPHCERRLKARPELAGKVLKCPKCLEKTTVPDGEDSASYALAGEGATPAGSPLEGRTSATVWQAHGYENLSAKATTRLAQARTLADRHEWERAASLLNRLFRESAGSGMTRENAVFRMPLSHCLTRWSSELLAGRKDDLSRPMRRLLEVASEKQKWGGSFDIQECGLCRKPLKSIAGRASVRTTVGTAYLCCAKPTKDDQRVAHEVNVIWQRLSLAAILDDQNENVRHAMSRLPAWQVPLRVDELSLGRGNAWVRWDAETDGLLSELLESAIEKAVDQGLGAIGGVFD